MAGNIIGGKKCAETNKKLYGDDFYRRIGAKGGQKTGLKGFAINRELAKEAGRKGGQISRRGPAKPKEEPVFHKQTFIERMFGIRND